MIVALRGDRSQCAMGTTSLKRAARDDSLIGRIHVRIDRVRREDCSGTSRVPCSTESTSRVPLSVGTPLGPDELSRIQGKVGSRDYKTVANTRRGAHFTG
jgi:hypothetical protein